MTKSELSSFSCVGKIRYEGAREALDILKRIKKQGKKHGGAYRCEVCGGYHIGHAKKPSKIRFESGND